MPRSAGLAHYVRSFDQPVAQVVDEAARTVPAFARRLSESGLDAPDLDGVDALDRLDILTKDELLDQQVSEPPFGGYVKEGSQIRRIFQSPGPIYEPQFELAADHWGAAPALRAAGFSSEDVVLNCFGYHLSPAGALFEDACFSVGAVVIPGGTGSKPLQARAIADLSVTGYTGTPSYLKALADQYRSEGLDPARWQVQRALVSAEPLPDSLREELSQWVPTVRTAYGTAETGILAYEDGRGPGLAVRDDVLVQICDVATGRPITEGEGQIVVSVLRPDYPLLRFGTGDLSAWLDAEGPPRLAGILGRLGQGVKVRGMFLHPTQISRVMDTIAGVDRYRMVVDRADHRDTLVCEVVLADDGATATSEELADRIRAGLRFSAEVVAVPSLPQACPVIDDRRNWD
jgi:phenylacetate-CoA ligase